MKKLFLVASLCALGMQQVSAQSLKLNENNIDEIVKAMTLEEKSKLLVGCGRSVAFLAAFGGNGMIGQHSDIVSGAAGSTWSLDRLGITPTVVADGPAGLRIAPTRKETDRTYYCTGFPVGISLASSWNTELVKEVGAAIGNEVLEYGVDVLLAPGMNLHRSPLCGRNFEYYSEDPVVTGKIAAAYVNGVQSNGVGTSIKHYAANSQETNRKGVNDVVAQRPLRELYLKGFEIAVREAQPWTVMSSYNLLNGEYTQESYDLLTTILRKEWGFNGIVMSDWTDKAPTRSPAREVHAGQDLKMPGSQELSDDLVADVKAGKVSMADVDLCVKRMLEYIVRTPRFKGYKFSENPDLKAHAAVTRQSATEGMVLLENKAETLPLKNVENLAVFGITSYDFIAGGTGSGNVNKAYTVSLIEGLNNAGLKPTQSLSDVYTAYKTYQENLNAAVGTRSSMLGKPVLPEMPIARNVIDVQAKEADMALLTIGRQAGEGRDRGIDNDFNLSALERQMLSDICDAFHMQGKKVVVVLNMGNAIETASWKDMPDAILMAWQPGQEGGNSVADVLTGKANPSGKLTMTFPINCTDEPSTFNFPVAGTTPQTSAFRAPTPVKNVDYTLHAEGMDVGYRYFNTNGVKVSYPFGYGLSYTTFGYSKPTVKAGKDGFVATITVTNTGKVAGKEVVQLYVSAPAGGLEKPAQELKAFAKTRELQPGESQTLTFTVDAYTLASFNESTSAWETAAGKYTLKFAANVEDVRATAVYTQAKAVSTPAANVLAPNMELK
ncbi:MAG: glycoside hydrolase family 3 C-terminal domain-containing protein [Bacteroidales bacterium]|nr:glycoside hydrolase family 3 C-terminal domain-containing protein [Bacteroidales bacterium]